MCGNEDRDTAVLRSGDRTRIYRFLDSIVRNTFRKQEIISKLRDAGDQIILVERKILEEIAAGTISTATITGQQFRNRIEEDIAARYNATAARARALHHKANYNPEKDIDLTSMLPRWRRHPGGHATSTGGLDPAREDALTAYETQGVPASQVHAFGATAGPKTPDAPAALAFEKVSDERDVLEQNEREIIPPISVLTWDSWWEMIDADWTITFRKPSRLKRSHEKFLQAAIDVIEERSWQSFGTRTDKLQKGRHGVILLKGTQAVGLHGLNKEMATRLKMHVRDVDQMWRDIRALKRFPADTVLERVPRKKYI